MHWDAYTTFSVLSGIALAACALFARDLKIHERLYAAGGGAIFLCYGVWVGHQSSGTYLFPIWIFVVPFGAVIYLVASHLDGDKPSQPSAQPRPGAVTQVAPPPPVATSVEPRANGDGR